MKAQYPLLYVYMAGIGRNALKPRNKFFLDYAELYITRKPQRRRGEAFEIELKRRYKVHCELLKYGPQIWVHETFFDPTYENLPLAFIRKPTKRLNTYQVLRYIKES